MVIPVGSFTSSPPSAFTTTKPRPASAMMTMNRMATDATTAAGLPSSARAISASDLPSRRTLAASITATPVAETTIIQIAATSVDPVEAADLANATATSLAQVVAEHETLAGDMITVEGSAEEGMTVTDGTVTANVLCGNIPTANATVYVVDTVLMPAS